MFSQNGKKKMMIYVFNFNIKKNFLKLINQITLIFQLENFQQKSIFNFKKSKQNGIYSNKIFTMLKNIKIYFISLLLTKL